MAVRNPWLKQKDRAPRYDKPPADPLETRMKNRLSIHPGVLDAVKSLRANIAKQRNTAADDVFVPVSEYMRVLEPFVMHKKLGEINTDYQMRANQRGLLTTMEVEMLIKQDMGYLGSQETKAEVSAHDKRLEELRREAQEMEAGQDLEMRPYLVNVSWVYEGSVGTPKRRGSPRVKYSIEGVFYGWDLETTMEAAREYITDNIADYAGYKAKAIMDVASFDVSAKPAAGYTAGAMEVSDDIVKKKYGDVMADERFTTTLNAFFENPETARHYKDREFGYADSTVRYRWVGNKIVSG